VFAKSCSTKQPNGSFQARYFYKACDSLLVIISFVLNNPFFKKLTVFLTLKIDSAASTGSQGEYMNLLPLASGGGSIFL